MGKTTKRLINRVVGVRSYSSVGVERSLRGLRTGDQRELYVGLALLALAYLEKTGPRKELLYSGKVKEGSALVIHHRRFGDPKITVRK